MERILIVDETVLRPWAIIANACQTGRPGCRPRMLA
jgi:hypothetical protein